MVLDIGELLQKYSNVTDKTKINKIVKNITMQRINYSLQNRFVILGDSLRCSLLGSLEELKSATF